MTEEALQAMVRDGVLPEKNVVGWRAAAGEAFPTPDTEEIVVFESFFYRGFGVPSSEFFRGLLRYYGIEIIHLNPNSILHISAFVELCEAFLGIRPHFNLFRALFLLKPTRGEGAGLAGSAGIQLRPGRASTYIGLRLKTSLKGWHPRWFYITNPAPPLPPHRGLRPLIRESWAALPTPGGMKQVEELFTYIQRRKGEGVTGVGVVANFINHRVQPLKERAHPSFEFSGPDDPTRESGALLPEGALRERLRALFASDAALTLENCPFPFSLSRPVDEVCVFVVISLSIFVVSPERSHCDCFCSGSLGILLLQPPCPRGGSPLARSSAKEEGEGAGRRGVEEEAYAGEVHRRSDDGKAQEGAVGRRVRVSFAIAPRFSACKSPSDPVSS